MTRQQLERHQVWWYLAAILSGLSLGLLLPALGQGVAWLLWPLLGLLLYTTFTQVPLTHLQDALRRPHFLLVAVVGNFVLLPLLVWLLHSLAPADPAVRVGILLVLLVPCTDWFITFSQLGRGDTRYAIALAPVSLLLQMALLPFYLWLMLGNEARVTLSHGDLLLAFVGLILLPLLLAGVTEWAAARRVLPPDLPSRLGWCPVPLLTMVVFIIALTQVNQVMAEPGLLLHVSVIFVAFLVLAGMLAWLLARRFTLPQAQGRVLAFSMGTRNSFVVLPLALALPPGYELAVVVIVLQSLVELLGMVVYLWWIPNRLFPASPGDPES